MLFCSDRRRQGNRMLFGQSIFQSVLERLKAEADEASDEDAPVSHQIRGLNSSFVAARIAPPPADGVRLQQAYRDHMPEEKPPAPKRMPAHLARTSTADVAAELDISQQDTVATLAEKRRSFARANHPDGIDPLFRDNATLRMKSANLLLDEAIRRLQR
jgi:hypothetical protein